jgi:hypothetical protein
MRILGVAGRTVTDLRPEILEISQKGGQPELVALTALQIDLRVTRPTKW